jgi:hypothetical protein
MSETEQEKSIPLTHIYIVAHCLDIGTSMHCYFLLLTKLTCVGSINRHSPVLSYGMIKIEWVLEFTYYDILSEQYITNRQ